MKIELDIYQDAFEQAPIGMAIVSPEGDWLEFNKSLEKITGYSRSELQKMTFQDITHQEDLDKDLELVNQMLKKKIDSYKLEKRYVKKNKDIVWVLLNVTLVWDGNDPKYFIAQIQDITESKKIRQDLSQKISELEKVNKVMVDRELKMSELKSKIKSLENKK